MGIIINLDVVMAQRKMGLTELSKKVDITMANLSILKNNKAKAIRFSTLEALCRALECQPGDLIAFEEDDLQKCRCDLDKKERSFYGKYIYGKL